MALFRVRRGIEEFGLTEDDILVALAPDYTDGQAFPILGSHHAASAGYAAVASVDDTRDFSVWPALTGNLDEFQLLREPSAAAFDRSVPWELVECLADPLSPDGFRVLAVVGIRFNAGVASKTSAAIATPGAVGNVVPFLVGTDYGGAATPLDGDRKTTLKIQADGKVLAERGSSGGALSVFVAVLKFGSAWTVQNNIEHAFATAGAIETESISAVDWTKTLCEGRVRGAGHGLDEAGAIIWPGSSTTIKAKLNASASSPTGFAIVCHTASHPGLTVEHLDSVDGGETDHASVAAIVNVTVASVDTTRTFLLGSNDCGGTGTAYPRQYWGFTLTGPTVVQWARSRAGQPSEWALQVIELPDGETLSPSSAVLEIVSPAPALSRELTPSSAVLELASPPTALSRELAPSSAVLELASPAPALSRELTPSSAVLALTSTPTALSRELSPSSAVLELRSGLRVKLSRELAPSSAVLTLVSPATTLSRDLTPSPAVLELAAPPATAAPGLPTIELRPSSAVLTLSSPRAALDFPGSCKVPFPLATLERLAADLALASVEPELASGESVSAELGAGGFSESFPATTVVSASLMVCT